ncbi:MAG: putative Sec-independent protein translocase protein TatB [Actinomycetota bacterium]
MFNIQGGELIFLLLIALLVLGPEKLPDAIRRFGRAYSEFKKMTNGFQGELKQVLDEPMRELRETAGLVREAADIDFLGTKGESAAPTTDAASPPARPGGSLNFGNASTRKSAPRDPEAADAPTVPEAPASPAPKPTGLNFGDPTRRRRPVGDDTAQVADE